MRSAAPCAAVLMSKEADSAVPVGRGGEIGYEAGAATAQSRVLSAPPDGLVRAEALRRVGDLPVAEEGSVEVVAASLVWPLDGSDAHLVRGARWTVHRDAGVLDVPVRAAGDCAA